MDEIKEGDLIEYKSGGLKQLARVRNHYAHKLVVERLSKEGTPLGYACVVINRPSARKVET